MSDQPTTQQLGEELRVLREKGLGAKLSRAELADILRQNCREIGHLDQSTIKKWEDGEGARDRIKHAVTFLRLRSSTRAELRVAYPEGPEGLLLRLIELGSASVSQQPAATDDQWSRTVEQTGATDLLTPDPSKFDPVHIGWIARDRLRDDEADVAVYANELAADAAEKTKLVRICNLCVMPAAAIKLGDFSLEDFEGVFYTLRFGVPDHSVFARVVINFAESHLLPNPEGRIFEMMSPERAIEAMKQRKIGCLVGPPNYVAKVHVELQKDGVQVKQLPLAMLGKAEFGLWTSEAILQTDKISALRNFLRRLKSASNVLHQLPNHTDGVPRCVEHLIDWPTGLRDAEHKDLQLHYAARCRFEVGDFNTDFLLQLWEREVQSSQQRTQTRSTP